MVTKATVNDVPKLMDWATKFHQASPYSVIPMDRDNVQEMLVGLITNGVVYFNDAGFIAGIMVPLYINRAFTVATEVAWWCPQGDGNELKEAFEDWGVEQGASAFQISLLNNEHLNRHAARLEEDEYRLVEVAYIRSAL